MYLQHSRNKGLTEFQLTSGLVDYMIAHGVKESDYDREAELLFTQQGNSPC